MIERLKAAARALSGKPQYERSGAFDGANVDRLFKAALGNLSGDAALQPNIRKLRDHWRELERNNDYGRRFLAEFQVNVAGPSGFAFQSDVRNDPTETHPKGLPDKLANQIITDAWERWCERYADMSRTMTFTDVEQIACRTAARDGEAVVQIVEGNQAGNPYAFSLHLMEADHLDEDINRPARNGQNEIRMGVELNGWRRPVAYYLRRSHPGDIYHPGVGRLHNRVDARNVIHIFFKERPSSTRGYPLGVSAIKGLKALAAYEEAEVTAARIQSCKAIFYEQEAGGHGNPYGKKDSDGRFMQDLEPGVEVSLPEGVKAHFFDPTHPGGNFGAFRKAILQGLSAGLISSYPTLAQDPAGINFSMIRAGLMIEREVWKLYQNIFRSQLHNKVFERWLEMAMLTQQVPLPLSKFEKFNQGKFFGRRWDYVDPARENRAAQRAIQVGLNSRRGILREHNMDLDSVLEELGEEREKMELLGLALPLNDNPNDTEPPDDSENEST